MKHRITSQRNNALNEADRLAIAQLLVKAGYTVRIGVEKVNGKSIYYVEYEE